ncbi:ABC transporter permease [Streptococcus sp. X16XC17]|uniref:ABC transporter permease n=1 Tax=unclassified Streptococcus TaxID=2608887 RepID=UPI00066FED6D|nr:MULTISPECIES: ABC transporter permease [unclassified Streptococcus]TCD46003.1 ABC transporter permease [Streptococcus sp. X16XC17]
MWKLMKIEIWKYRGVPMFRLLTLAVVITLLVSATAIFQINDSKELADPISVYTVMDSIAFINVILLPTILAGIASMAVQLEERHNMWKVLASSGVAYRVLYRTKFLYIYACYVLMQLLEWACVVILLRWRGFTGHVPVEKLVFYGLSILAISGCLLLLHYVISLKWSNQLVNLSIAVLGSLMGIIIILISKSLMMVQPYSWYGFLMSVHFEKVGDRFVKHLGEMSSYPLSASLLLGILVYQLGKRMKVGGVK